MQTTSYALTFLLFFFPSFPLLLLLFSFLLLDDEAPSLRAFFLGGTSASSSLSASGSTFGGAWSAGGLGDRDETLSSLSSPASDSDSAARARFFDEALAALSAALAARAASFLILGATAEEVAAVAAGEKGSGRSEPVSEIIELATVMLSKYCSQ